jgi:alpha-ketoglutarate-dependent taurine dioxygenase
MSFRQPRRGEYREPNRSKQSQTSIVFEVCPAQRPSADTATASSSMSSHTRGAFDFTVVNGSVTHCEWTPASGSDNLFG